MISQYHKNIAKQIKMLVSDRCDKPADMDALMRTAISKSQYVLRYKIASKNHMQFIADCGLSQ